MFVSIGDFLNKIENESLLRNYEDDRKYSNTQRIAYLLVDTTNKDLLIRFFWIVLSNEIIVTFLNLCSFYLK